MFSWPARLPPLDCALVVGRSFSGAADEQVKRTEPELWRTKQVSDFLCGIWGQTYGPAYASVIRVALQTHFVAEYATPALAILVIVRGLQLRTRSRRLTRVATATLAVLGPPFP